MNRDFKGIWIPRALWESRIPAKDLEKILNSFYFCHTLNARLWTILNDRGWAELDKFGDFQFTNDFNNLWLDGVKNE